MKQQTGKQSVARPKHKPKLSEPADYEVQVGDVVLTTGYRLGVVTHIIAVEDSYTGAHKPPHLLQQVDCATPNNGCGIYIQMANADAHQLIFVADVLRCYKDAWHAVEEQ
ncbi:hypothetical protein [Paracidobacterium acidisoli]|uniref:Uncharacterized protein n=1 Tax=Paracidobacterium acidisoli TaxID=2303751 RepID=A0A372IQE3_9BACT|nr:hypothetical protein [Paracidobacterium acidisoli]MBT9331489.1 hypothetical protein [Paracidobacterium acidisoli]